MPKNAKGRGANKGTKPRLLETHGVVRDSNPGDETHSAHDIFLLCIARARNLVKLHKAAHGRQARPEPYMSDAHRAAIVLAVSALDAFVRSFVVDRVRSILADRANPLPSELATRIKAFLKEDQLLEAARRDDLIERVAKAFRADFSRRSFQGTKVIAEYVRLVGIDDIFHDVAVAAGRNQDTLCADLDRFTERRHAIAHRGDYDISVNPPRELVISKKDAEDCIKVMTVVAKHIHELGG